MLMGLREFLWVFEPTTFKNTQWVVSISKSLNSWVNAHCVHNGIITALLDPARTLKVFCQNNFSWKRTMYCCISYREIHKFSNLTKKTLPYIMKIAEITIFFTVAIWEFGVDLLVASGEEARRTHKMPYHIGQTSVYQSARQSHFMRPSGFFSWSHH
jgi:hypothetical protein